VLQHPKGLLAHLPNTFLHHGLCTGFLILYRSRPGLCSLRFLFDRLRRFSRLLWLSLLSLI
jgi:hypothetical protein